MIRVNTLRRSGLRAAIGHIAGNGHNAPVTWEGITLAPEPSAGIDRGRRVTLYGRGLPESLRGRVVDVRTATGLMLGDRIGDQPVHKRRGHIEGYGLVWGASKSVSLLLAVLDDAQRQALLLRFEDAVRRAIDDMEQWLWVRRGAGGKKIERISGGLCAYAIHVTSGRGDPHLHVHVLLRAVGRCEDGVWRTIDSDSVLEMAKKILDARIARYLQEALAGIGIYTKERVVGTVPTLEVPDLEPLVSHFSARSRDVRAKDKGNGWRDALRAWYESRRGLSAEALEHAMDTEVLQGTEIGRAIIATWQQRLLNCDPIALASVRMIRESDGDLLAYIRERVRKGTDMGMRQREASTATLEAMLDQAGDIVRMSDLLAFQAYKYDDYTGDTALAEIEHVIQARMVNGISGWREALRSYRAGTVDRKAAYHVLGKGGILIQAEGMRVTKAIDREWRKLLHSKRQVPIKVGSSDGLTEEQRDALALIASGRRAVIIVGTAGAGKSQVLERVLSEKFVLTRNAVLGHDLVQRVGGQWATLARADALLHEVEARDARGEHSVLVIDEGSLVDREDWLHILWRFRKLKHTQLVVLGDPKQIESIDRTHIFRLLVDRARETNGCAELRTSKRTQEWQEEHQALRTLSRHEESILAFSRMLIQRGGLEVVGAGNLEQHVARRAAEQLQQSKQVVVIVSRNEDAARISELVQKQLGITPDQHVELMDGQRCGVGDVVRLRKNDYGLNVFNGMAGIVMEVNPDGVRVKLGDREVTLPAAYCKEGLQLGYAITADSSQGLTVEQAIVMVDGMDYRRVYVAATRSRRPPLYVASSLQALGTALATRDEHTPPRTAADILRTVADIRERRKDHGISM